MAYLRHKVSGGQTYYQLVRSYREGGKVKQEVLAYLGKDPSPEGIDAKIAEHEALAAQQRRNVEWALEHQHGPPGASEEYRERFRQRSIAAHRRSAEHHEATAQRLREARAELHGVTDSVGGALP